MNTIQVLGFLINNARVLLVQKRSPAWQKGRLNGIGGIVENGESPEDAMKRHGLNDLGYKGAWQEYAKISRESWSCKVYWGIFTEQELNNPAPKEHIAGIYELEDFKYLPLKTPLVTGVDILVHAAFIRERNPDSPYIILQMNDSISPHPIDIVADIPREIKKPFQKQEISY